MSRLKRESRENRERTRRCDGGRNSPKTTVLNFQGWEGVRSRAIPKPEDLPGCDLVSVFDGQDGGVGLFIPSLLPSRSWGFSFFKTSLSILNTNRPDRCGSMWRRRNLIPRSSGHHCAFVEQKTHGHRSWRQPRRGLRSVRMAARGNPRFQRQHQSLRASEEGLERFSTIVSSDHDLS